MITTPTVLILGAGASRPYGFPSAGELLTLIYRDFQSDSVACRAMAKSGIAANSFFQFREELRKSGQPSVDSFLEHRPEWIKVGKLAIAYCLMPYEREENLFSCDGSRGGNWYQYLFGKLNAPFDKFGDNRLAVITFNYDRSLEHYLLTTLQNKYGKDRHQCIKALSNIPIVHVYGQLSVVPYPDVERNSNGYQPDREPFTAVECAAEGIRILGETDRPLDNAHQLLVSAERICFLGFSYHELNVSRLTIKEAGSKRIFGTARGLIGEEVTDAANRVRKALGSAMTNLSQSDSLELLRANMVLG